MNLLIAKLLAEPSEVFELERWLEIGLASIMSLSVGF